MFRTFAANLMIEGPLMRCNCTKISLREATILRDVILAGLGEQTNDLEDMVEAPKTETQAQPHRENGAWVVILVFKVARYDNPPITFWLIRVKAFKLQAAMH